MLDSNIFSARVLKKITIPSLYVIFTHLYGCTTIVDMTPTGNMTKCAKPSDIPTNLCCYQLKDQKYNI